MSDNQPLNQNNKNKFSSKSEQFINQLIICSNDIIFAMNEEKEIVLFNPSAQDMFGYSESEIIEKHYKILFNKESDYQLIDKVLDDTDQFTGDVVNITKEGTIFHTYLSVSTIQVNGSEKGYIGISKDITDRKQMDNIVKKLSQFHEVIIDNINIWFCVFDEQANLIVWNKAAEMITGYTADELIKQKNFFDILFPDQEKRKEVINIVRSRMNDNSIEDLELEINTKNGYTKFVSFFARKIIDADNKTIGIALVGFDRTEKKKSEEQERLNTSVFENIIEGILITDSKGIVKNINPAFTQMTGYTLEDMVDKKTNILKSARQRDEEFSKKIWQKLYKDGQWSGEIWSRRKNGEVYPIWLSVSSVRNDKNEITNFVAIANDITGRKKYEKMIKFKAYHDALTGLPNRDLLIDRLKLAINQSDRNYHLVAIMFLDLDGFKQVNDEHGHHVGDILLQVVAERLKGIIRRGDTLARLGGDEFTLVLNRIENLEYVEQISNNVLKVFHTPFSIGGKIITLGTSIGISLYPDDGDEPEELIEKADKAMYKVKETGKNGFTYFSEIGYN